VWSKRVNILVRAVILVIITGIQIDQRKTIVSTVT